MRFPIDSRVFAFQDVHEFSVKKGMAGRVVGYGSNDDCSTYYHWIRILWDVPIPGWGEKLYIHSDNLKLEVFLDKGVTSIRREFFKTASDETLWKELVG